MITTESHRKLMQLDELRFRLLDALADAAALQEQGQSARAVVDEVVALRDEIRFRLANVPQSFIAMVRNRLSQHGADAVIHDSEIPALAAAFGMGASVNNCAVQIIGVREEARLARGGREP